MTRDEILNMPAGREMDALVAERVMRQTDFTHPDVVYLEGATEDGSDGWSGFYCPRCHAGETSATFAMKCTLHYSADIADAWHVVDALKDKHGEVYFEWRNECYPNPRQWLVMFGDLDDDIIAFAETPALAICRAALLAAEEVTGG